MNVTTILKSKGRNIITTTPDTLVQEIAKTLAKHKIGCIVVTQADKTIAGIVSERDIVRSIANAGLSALEKPVSSCMTKNVITCRESDTIDQLMAEMTAGRFRHLPVVDGNVLVGLISIGDVVKLRIAEAEMEAAAMRDYIATG